MIRFDNVSKSYQAGVHALNDVNIEIDEGEFVFVTGQSGSGKSTMIKLLLGEVQPTEGEVYVNDKALSTLKHRNVPMYRRNIGCVFQDFRLLPDRNVFDNVAFAMKVVEASSRDIRKRVPQVLSMVGLAAKYRSLPNQLSGGEQQRVAIARALVNRPKIILADEPTGNLDVKNAWDIMQLLEQINELGTTVIVVTHDPSIIKRMGKRVITMEKGGVLSDVRPEVSDEV